MNIANDHVPRKYIKVQKNEKDRKVQALGGKKDISKPFLTIKVEWIIKAYLTGSLK